MRIPPRLLAMLSAAGLPAAAAHGFTASISREPDGRAVLTWQAEAGREFRVEWSTDMRLWTSVPALPRLYGLGQEMRLPVTGPPRTASTMSFFGQGLPDGRTLISWYEEGARWRAVVALTLADGPGARVDSVDDAAAGVSFTVRTTPGAWEESFEPLTPESLPAARRTTLEMLTNRYAAILANRGQPLKNTLPGPGDGGATKRYFRVVVFDADTDGDGLIDSAELATPGLDALAADTDGDGMNDGVETTQGNDPLDFFNGLKPVLEVNRPAQVPAAAAGAWLAPAWTVTVRNSSGAALVNAPVGFSVWKGDGKLARSVTGTKKTRLSLRTGSDGKATAAFASGTLLSAANVVQVWTGTGARLAFAPLVSYTTHAVELPEADLALCLRADRGLTFGQGSPDRIQEWRDARDSMSRAFTAPADSYRPLLDSVTGLPAVKFEGAQALRLSSALSAGDTTMVYLAAASVTRTSQTASVAHSARGAGLTGQRYLLSGADSGTASPWDPPVNNTPAKPAAKYISGWVSKYTPDRVTPDGYRPAYVFEVLPYYINPSLPQAQRPTVRFDNTNAYRLAPAPVGPHTGRTVAQMTSVFLADVEPNHFKDWNTTTTNLNKQWKQYAGTPSTQISVEDYYSITATTWKLATTEYKINTGKLGAPGMAFSLGSNAAGTYEHSNDYHPCTGNWTSATGLQMGTVKWTGKKSSLHKNGAAATSGPDSPAGSRSGFLTLGARPKADAATYDHYFQGHVTDIAVYSKSLPDDTRQLAEDAIAARHGVLKPDRDADALPDWWERRFFNARTSTAAGNTDADALTNSAEFKLAVRTSPACADSDGDGIKDGAETTGSPATSPVNPDTDGDGFPDNVDTQPANPANGQADVSPANGIPDGTDWFLTNVVAGP